jgi:branched-subunit amino acid aminotransferase/4-amino-4-deoxychorismate lyase
VTPARASGASAGLYRLLGGRLVSCPDDDARCLAVADSWLLRDGAVRALDLHRARFDASCRARGVPDARLAAFWSGVDCLLPGTGAWFPRAELTAAGELRLRPAPALGTGLTASPHPGPDPRAEPRTKGPDIERLARARAGAVAHGADEALLLSGAGFVLEGTTTSLLWWDGDTLCLPSAALPVLPGVTASLLVRLAREEQVPVRYCHARLPDLSGRETWLVNALHGIRPVTAWRGVALAAGRPARAAAWSARLGAQAAPTQRAAEPGGDPRAG